MKKFKPTLPWWMDVQDFLIRIIVSATTAFIVTVCIKLFVKQ